LGKVYHFDQEYKKGLKGERILDEWFKKRGYPVEEVNREKQRRGIDRLIFVEDQGRYISVEYKTDFMAKDTGNFFMEEVSVDTQNKEGWLTKSEAEYLIFFVYPLYFYLLQFDLLNIKIPIWDKKYDFRRVSIPNDGYNTLGFLLYEFLIASISKKFKI